MTWYKKAKIGKNLTKTASISQDSWSYDLGDFQRWVVDSFSIEVFKTGLSDSNTISVNIYNRYVGTMVYQEFWKYGLNEKSKQAKTYKSIIKTCEEVSEYLMLPENESQPKNMLTPMLRAKLWEIDREHMPQSNIPHINYYRDKVTPVSDWRSSIYGTRYPEAPTTGH